MALDKESRHRTKDPPIDPASRGFMPDKTSCIDRPPVKRDRAGRIKQGSGPINANGRPRTVGLTTLLKRMLAMRDPNMPCQTMEQTFVESILKRAIEGNSTLAQEILNRMEGKVADKVVQQIIEGWTAVECPPRDEELN